MSLLKEAVDRRNERKFKLDRIAKLHSNVFNVIKKHAKPGSNLTTEGHIKGFGLEIPQNESKTVMVQVFTILLRGNEKELSIHDPIGISIDDLSRCIRLKGHDTVIIDTSVTPKKYSKIDQISLNELEQWEEVFNSFEKATLILNN